MCVCVCMQSVHTQEEFRDSKRASSREGCGSIAGQGFLKGSIEFLREDLHRRQGLIQSGATSVSRGSPVAVEFLLCWLLPTQLYLNLSRSKRNT